MIGSERLDWIDYARGVCIILVVMMHFHGVFYNYLAFPDFAKFASDGIVSAARPARMPTFFFISGFLASRALERPWRNVFDSRIGLLYWTYLLWSIIATAILFVIFETATIENAQRFAAQITVQVFYPRQSTWFLYGLVMFFVAARLLRKWNVIFTIFALVASAFSEHISDLATSEMLRSLPYFLTGIYAPSLFHKAAGEPSLKRCLALFSAYVVTIIPVLFARDIPGIWLPATVIGIMLLLSVSRLLDGAKGSAVIRYVGRNTLPIYVMHISLLLIARETIPPFTSGYGWAAFVWIIGIAALIGLCLGLSLFFKSVGMGWLFSQPESVKLKRWDERLASRESV